MKQMAKMELVKSVERKTVTMLQGQSTNKKEMDVVDSYDGHYCGTV